MDDPGRNLARNLRQLRELRRLTQAQLAKLADVPRPTLATLESGSANPTLSVLTKVSGALGVSIEELIGAPRATGTHHPVESLQVRSRGGVRVREVLPERLPHLEIERMEFSVGGKRTGTPHTRGTREYLTCERGRVELVVSGQRFVLEEGDVVVFRGDQRHSYRAVDGPAVAYSVVAISHG